MNEKAQISIIAFDLFNAEASIGAHEMSMDIKEVAEGLRVAKELSMRLLFVAMDRSMTVSCIPVADFSCIMQALDAISNVTSAKDHGVSWMMVPPSLGDLLIPYLQVMEERLAAGQQLHSVVE